MVKERETILFVVNPFAGIGNIGKLSNRISKSLHNSRYSALVVVADETTDLQTLVQGHLNSGCNKVFAVGGNAAVSRVATHLVNTHASLGIVPIGSGNGLARHLRIPLDIDKAIKLVHRQKIAMIDYGLANSTPFFCNAGFGFDADMAIRFNTLTKRNFWNYTLATVSEFSRAKSKLYRINSDGHNIHKEVFSISVANATRYGHNAIIAPDADTADGFLDVTIISPFPKIFAPSIATKLFNGKISKSRYVEIFRVSQLEVEPEDSSSAMHLDGIAMATGNSVAFGIKPLGLKVYVP